MPERLRVAVIGTGGIGLEHLKSLMQCPRVSTVAVCENNPKRARDAADRYKIPRIYADYHELLEQPDVDAVTIALPNSLHAPVALDAIKARKHVLLEKPMATNAKDAAKIVEAAKKTRLVVMVGQDFRFNRGTQLARILIERGDLGEVHHAQCFWLRRNGIPRIGSWFTRKELSGGGCAIDLGVHLIDTALHLLGDFNVASVSAQTKSVFGSRGQGEYDWGKGDVDPARTFDVEDHCTALIKLKSGKTISLETSWAGFPPPDGREYGIDLCGASGGLSLFPARFFKNGPNGYETINLALPKLSQSEDRLHHFVQCVIEGKKPLVLLDESLKVQQVLDAIYLSASTGKEALVK